MDLHAQRHPFHASLHTSKSLHKQDRPTITLETALTSVIERRFVEAEDGFCGSLAETWAVNARPRGAILPCRVHSHEVAMVLLASSTSAW